MRIVPVLSAIAVAVLLGAPASASWSSFGNAEPDNSYDDASFMRTDPPEGDDLIYFNAWSTQAIGIVGWGTNPNLALLATRSETPTLESHVAILGVWVDCNGDGYVGLAESAVSEYDATLLLDTSACPPGIGPTGTWDGSHNYNGWVTELLTIGGYGGGPNNLDDFHGDGIDDDDAGDLRILRDAEAKIWGDFGLPDAGSAPGASSCPIRPFPRKTLMDTGGILDYVDCHADRFAGIVDAPGLLESWNAAVGNGGDPLGLAFSDDDNGRSGTAGQQTLAGDESDENAAVYVMDCDGAPLLHSGDTVNSTGIGDSTGVDPNEEIGFFVIPAVDPRAGEAATPTLAGQANSTNEEIVGDCDGSNNEASIWEGVEDDFEGVVGGNKKQSDLNFAFEDSGRVLRIADLLVFIGNDFASIFGVEGPLPSTGAREDGGSGRSLGREATLEMEWASPVAFSKTGPRTVRGDFSGPDAPEYVTFYAHVGEATTSRGFATLGGSGVYGSAQCGSETGGIRNGWNCDATTWYKNAADGTAQPEVEGGNGRPGDVYEFRDVDCYDGGNSLGVPLGVPALGDEACQSFE